MGISLIPAAQRGEKAVPQSGGPSGTARLWVRRSLMTAVCVYGVILIAATHWPRLDAPRIWSPLFPPDKTLHIVAYAVLATLTMIAFVVCPGGFRPRIWHVLLALAGFALIDEITQPLVGRAAEPLDFVADLAGIVVGIVIAKSVAWFAWQYRKRSPVGGSSNAA